MWLSSFFFSLSYQSVWIFLIFPQQAAGSSEKLLGLATSDWKEKSSCHFEIVLLSKFFLLFFFILLLVLLVNLNCEILQRRSGTRWMCTQERMISFLYFFLPVLGGYTLTSVYLLKNPQILHRKKRPAFYCKKISHRGGKDLQSMCGTQRSWCVEVLTGMGMQSLCPEIRVLICKAAACQSASNLTGEKPKTLMLLNVIKCFCFTFQHFKG